MTPEYVDASNQLVQAVAAGYGLGIGFVVLVLITRRRGGD